ncbi:glucosylceramidase [Neolewinella xylanilytica]|uniref:Glucosylceramidase n=1 Tax=Neolewinella xylanilytica TaxID=1514080 RepID=A0A2S6I5L2_9BACT|nr:glycoside hydrolase family 30 beta sandwich domain-containing protein [Neolewinella xylanilytica]PPK86419.1 glucosylceramidase [Neolewinella xylanilytica]
MRYGYLFLLSTAVTLTTCRPRLEEVDLLAPTDRLARAWVTTADSSELLEVRGPIELVPVGDSVPEVLVDPSLRYQEVQGFGYTLTGGSAQLIHELPDARRRELLEELFANHDSALGVSYLRLSLGASDLDPAVFSYSDLPPGETDPEMRLFSLDPDRRHLIPVLKEILEINPDIRLMASPWSPPVWMKDNRTSKGGSLLPEFYPAYARYFVKYIQGMAAEGIPIDAITVQNEPLHPGNNPSLLMLPEDQAEFVGKHLGPAFAEAGIDTRIVIYDHNADRPDYPLTILKDSTARPYVDGSAFHLYGGSIDALTEVHRAFPDKHLYFTEQWIGAPGDFAEDLRWHVRELIIGATRNWAETVLEWNLAADANQDPHTEGGCSRCLGALTIENGNVHRNTAYYIIGHASRAVPPGSYRIDSRENPSLPNVAFLTPDDRVVVVVLNDGDAPVSFDIGSRQRSMPVRLDAGAVGTFSIPAAAF